MKLNLNSDMEFKSIMINALNGTLGVRKIQDEDDKIVFVAVDPSKPLSNPNLTGSIMITSPNFTGVIIFEKGSIESISTLFKGDETNE